MIENKTFEIQKVEQRTESDAAPSDSAGQPGNSAGPEKRIKFKEVFLTKEAALLWSPIVRLIQIQYELSKTPKGKELLVNRARSGLGTLLFGYIDAECTKNPQKAVEFRQEIDQRYMSLVELITPGATEAEITKTKELIAKGETIFKIDTNNSSKFSVVEWRLLTQIKLDMISNVTDKEKAESNQAATKAVDERRSNQWQLTKEYGKQKIDSLKEIFKNSKASIRDAIAVFRQPKNQFNNGV